MITQFLFAFGLIANVFFNCYLFYKIIYMGQFNNIECNNIKSESIKTKSIESNSIESYNIECNSAECNSIECNSVECDEMITYKLKAKNLKKRRIVVLIDDKGEATYCDSDDFKEEL